MFPNCVMFDLIIEHEIFFEPYRCTYFLFDPTPNLHIHFLYKTIYKYSIKNREP